MGLDNLPISLRVSYINEHQWQTQSAPANLFSPPSPQSFFMQFFGAPDYRRLLIVLTGGFDFTADIELGARLELIMSDGAIAYDGPFGGDTANPYYIDITETGYLSQARAVENDMLRAMTLRLTRIAARPVPVAARTDAGHPSHGIAAPIALAARTDAGHPSHGIAAPIALAATAAIGVAVARPVARPIALSAAAAIGTAVARPVARPIALSAAALIDDPTPLIYAAPAATRAQAALTAPQALRFPVPVPLAVTASLASPHARSRVTSHEVTIRASAPTSITVACIEIDHPESPGGPVRLVNNTVDLEIDGETYFSTRFEARLSSDVERRAPSAQLIIGNVGREISNWLDAVGGGAGGSVRIFEVTIDDGGASDIDWEIEMDIGSIECRDVVTITLGYEPLLGRPAVAVRYDPETAPGIF